MFPPQHPCSPTGQLESDIRTLRSELHNKANSYEITSFNSRLDSLERTVSEVRSEITGIWNRLQELSPKTE
jgi:hypothetical protein